MPIPFFSSTHNTPQIANPRARNIFRVNQDPARSQVMDLWVHPEKYRFYEESKNYPSLDILA